MVSNSVHKEWIDLALKSTIELSLQTDCVATCCQILHRLWCYIRENDNEKEKFEIGNVVSASILIATKSCECETRLSTLILTVYEKQTLKTITVNDDIYWKLRQSVVNMENIILRILGFNITFELPHKYVMFYLKLLSDWIDNAKLIEELTTMSLSLLNDYYCSNMNSSKHSTTQLAVTCIDIAIEVIEPTLRKTLESRDTTHRWFENFDNTFTTEEFNNLKRDILATYPC